MKPTGAAGEVALKVVVEASILQPPPLPLIGSNDPHYCSSNHFIIHPTPIPQPALPHHCRFDY